jgi:predicted RNA binding protein YcfA (HicA-like mRNA interferase family)
MPALGSIKRKDLIWYLKKMQFDGPYSGGKHQFMIKGNVRLTLPNPHRQEISIGLLSKILKQAGIEKIDWEKL